MKTYNEFLTEAVKFSPDKKIMGVMLNAPVQFFKPAGSYTGKVYLGDENHTRERPYHVSIVGDSAIVTIDMSSKVTVFERLVDGKIKTAKVKIYPHKSTGAFIDTFGRMTSAKPYHFQGWSREDEGCLVEVIFK